PHAPQACALPGCATSRLPDLLSCQRAKVKFTTCDWSPARAATIARATHWRVVSNPVVLQPCVAQLCACKSTLPLQTTHRYWTPRARSQLLHFPRRRLSAYHHREARYSIASSRPQSCTDLRKATL